jgi:hypothetical protein
MWRNSFKPDEVREFPSGRVELVDIGGPVVGRAVLEAGRSSATRWSAANDSGFVVGDPKKHKLTN